MKTTVQTARRRLRAGNPVPEEAFRDAARDSFGQQAFADILARSSEPAPPAFPSAAERAKAPQRPARTRLRWPFSAPAAAAAAVAAVIVAVSLISAPPPGAPAPNGILASLAADLTYHPPAHPADPAAVLRKLADAAAAQPAPALGPVEYVKAVGWGLDVGSSHYGLSYRSHELTTQQSWVAADGSSLRVTRWADGKIPPGVMPVSRSGASEQGQKWRAWSNPATLPADPGVLRKHLLNPPQPGFGSGGRSDAAQTLMSAALGFMLGEPLPPAVRAAMLRLMAEVAAARVPDARLVSMGTVTDRAGHTGIAIGYEIPAGSSAPVALRVLIFDPGTGALLGQEWAYCQGQLGTQPVDRRCFATSYDQILQITAVPAIPAAPVASPSGLPAVPAVGSPTP